MSDLIYRQDAIDTLNEYFVRIGKLKRRGLTKGEKAISLDTVGAIKTLPSAERTGHWIYDAEAYPLGNPYGHYDCDQCGESVPYKTKYCPNCGAKMEVKHE